MRLLRFLGVVAVAGIALFCVLLLSVRYVAFPRVEEHRDDIAAMIGRQLGQPVEIDRLTTGWDGWNPKIVVSGLRVRDRAGALTQPLLELPQVQFVIAWASVPLMELRLRELVIERPRLALRRDTDGRIHVAGIEIDPSATADDSGVTDWLLRQREIVVRDALITWNDDLRNAPQLVLDRVQFRLEHRLGSSLRRFGVTGVPPTELAAPLELRGEFHGGSLADWRNARGRMFVRLDYADVAAWREWIPLPVPIESGKGALRVWFAYSEGTARDITADVEIADVRARVRPELPPLELAHLAGRLQWKQDDKSRSFRTDDLSFRLADGRELPASDFALDVSTAEDGTIVGGKATFPTLELAPLASIAPSLPFPPSWREAIAAHAPRGTMSKGRYEWTGPAESPATYDASGEIADFGIEARGSVPGVSRLAGRFDVDQKGGTLKITGKGGTLAAPKVLADPLALDALAGTVKWEHAASGLVVHVQDLAVANADLAGTASGTWHEQATGRGTVDLKAQLDRADAQRLGRYLPRDIDPAVRDWLRVGILKGRIDNVKLTLQGNLAEFPFPANKNGTFLLAVKGRDATIDYADHWPKLEDVDGDLRFEGTRMALDVTRASVLGVPIARTRIEIPDVRESHPLLKIDGEAAGTTEDFLRFINQSPVAGWSGHFADAAHATGNGRLKLKLEVPLGKGELPKGVGPKVDGEFTFVNNVVRIPGVPTMSQVNGTIVFTQERTTSRDLAADVLGGPAKLTVASTDSGLRVTAAGNANLAAVKAEWPLPMGEYFTGTTDWQLVANVRDDGASWVVDAPMRGANVDLPAPLGKAAAETAPLRIERRAGARTPNEDSLTVDYPRAGRLLMHRKLAGGEPTVDRALLLLGRAVDKGGEPDRPGLWVRGEATTLNLDDWLALRARHAAQQSASASTQGGLALMGVDFDVGALDAFGRKLTAIRVNARPAGDEWRLGLNARELAGSAVWQAPSSTLPSGRVVARLARLEIPKEGQLTPWSGAAEGQPARAEGAANPWPELDVVSDTFLSKGRDLGRFEMVARPVGTDWKIEKMVLANDAGRIATEGWWRAASLRTQQTRLDATLEAKDAGAFLLRFGFPAEVRGAPTKITGQLEWPGSPADFDYDTLSGTFRVETGPGQFTKIDPGMGKLVSLLSLQALPRRIALDFRDVFSEGFSFDTILGNVRIAKGQVHTENLLISGSAAKVMISGDADLQKETQKLLVRVQPALATSFSAGTAGAAMLLLAANPVVGAAVAAGTLLAQKIMKDPIEQMFSYEYRVTGEWSDPVVERVAKTQVGSTAVPGEPPKQ